MSGVAITGQRFALLQRDTGVHVIDLIGPIEVVAGDDLDLILTVTDDTDAREDLTALTADDIRVRLGLEAGGPSLLEYIIGAGVTLLDQTDPDTKGQALVTISGADLTLAARLYSFEATVVLGGKRQHIIIPRAFTILPALGAKP